MIGIKSVPQRQAAARPVAARPGRRLTLAATSDEIQTPIVVELEGEIDIHGMPGVVATLKASVKRRTSAVVVSFERNSSFESGLLRELMRISKALTADQRRLLIVMPREHPGRHIFHLLNLDKKFECYDSTELALRNTSASGASRGSDRDRLQSWAERRTEPIS
jgi:anti-anti-sigma factor